MSTQEAHAENGMPPHAENGISPGVTGAEMGTGAHLDTGTGALLDTGYPVGTVLRREVKRGSAVLVRSVTATGLAAGGRIEVVDTNDKRDWISEAELTEWIVVDQSTPSNLPKGTPAWLMGGLELAAEIERWAQRGHSHGVRTSSAFSGGIASGEGYSDQAATFAAKVMMRVRLLPDGLGKEVLLRLLDLHDGERPRAPDVMNEINAARVLRKLEPVSLTTINRAKKATLARLAGDPIFYDLVLRLVPRQHR